MHKVTTHAVIVHIYRVFVAYCMAYVLNSAGVYI